MVEAYEPRQMRMESISDFIQSNPDPRELKRALAVQTVMREYTCFEIRDVLQVSVGFIIPLLWLKGG